MREACWSPKMLNPSDPGAVACWKWVFLEVFFRPVCDFLVMNYKDKVGPGLGYEVGYVTQGLPSLGQFCPFCLLETTPKGCINQLHLPELSQGWQDLLGHPGCPCCWLSCFMSQDLPPPHNSFLQGVFVPSKAVGRQKLQPGHPNLSPGPGTLVPVSQGSCHIPTGAKLASAGSAMRVGMRMRKLCIHLPTPNLRLSSSPASSSAQMSQLSIQQFGSSFCLTFSTPSPEAAVPTWLRTVKPGTESHPDREQGARCPGAGMASGNFPNTLKPQEHPSWPNMALPLTLIFTWLQCTDAAQ